MKKNLLKFWKTWKPKQRFFETSETSPGQIEKICWASLVVFLSDFEHGVKTYVFNLFGNEIATFNSNVDFVDYFLLTCWLVDFVDLLTVAGLFRYRFFSDTEFFWYRIFLIPNFSDTDTFRYRFFWYRYFLIPIFHICSFIFWICFDCFDEFLINYINYIYIYQLHQLLIGHRSPGGLLRDLR